VVDIKAASVRDRKMKATLVLLPGLNGTIGLFNPLLEQVQDRFEVMPVSYPEDKVLSYAELTQLVLARLKSISGNYVLLGESFSGPVSLLVSCAKPKGLVGIILVATFVRAPNLYVGKYLPWRSGFILASPLYRIALAFASRENPSTVSLVSQEMRKVSPVVLAARIREIFDVKATDALRQCDVPLVYFRGARDIIVPYRNLRQILEAKPEVKVVEFDTHHFLLQTVPVEAITEIRKFIELCS